MPRKAIHETGKMEGLPLNIRLTKQQHELLERLAAAEKADMAAKLGGFAPPFTRADLIRQWIENAARARGFAPPAPAPPAPAPAQGMLFPAAVVSAAVVSAPVQVEPEAPAPVQVEPEAPAPVEPEAPAPVQVEPEAPAPVQVEPEAPAPVQVEPEAPAPVQVEPEAPVKRRRGKVEPDDVQAALGAAIAAGEKQKDIGAAAGVDPSTMSKFLKGTREIPKDKLPALVKHLRKLGYLK